MSVLLAALLSPAGAGAETLSDPTRPTSVRPEAAAAPRTMLTVSAVFISGERRVAIVNGRRVREGDTVSGATVTRIAAREVSFERDGETLAVPLLAGRPRN